MLLNSAAIPLPERFYCTEIPLPIFSPSAYQDFDLHGSSGLKSAPIGRKTAFSAVGSVNGYSRVMVPQCVTPQVSGVPPRRSSRHPFRQS